MFNKKLLVLIVIIVAMLSVVALSSCDAILTISDVTLECINENAANIEVGGFSYDDYVLNVTYSDGSVQQEKLTEDMISSYEKLKLHKIGKQVILVNYHGHELSITVNIASKKQTGIYMDGITTTYDGNPHSVQVSGDIPELAEIVYTPQQSFTNAGIYEVSAVISAPNFETTQLQCTVIINKAVYDLSNVTFEDSPIYTYDKSLKSLAIQVDGNLPEGLKYSYTIGTTQGRYENDQSGNSAIDAGTYYVSCIFDGDYENYESTQYTKTIKDKQGKEVKKTYQTQEGLRLVATLQINKATAASILKEWNIDISELSFNDETWTYNGQSRLIQVSIPEKMVSILEQHGIRVEYYCDGKIFKGTKEVGQYDITAKFKLDSTVNYEVTETLSATLTIVKATYNVRAINFASQTLAYDTHEHMILAENVPENLKVTKYTIDGNEYDGTGLTDAGRYEITAYFEGDENHNPVNPITVYLQINALTFGIPSINFKDQTVAYDGEKHSFAYSINGLPDGVKYTLYIKNNDEYVEGYPKDKIEVGEYYCRVKFEFNKQNYIGAPNLDIINAKLVIERRVFNAETYVPLLRTERAYTGYNLSTELSYSVEIPSWVKEAEDALIVKKSTGEEVDTSNVWEAGYYDYQYKFEYFDGVETVYALTKTAVFKIIGMKITEVSDSTPNGKYKLTPVANFTYDGVTSAMPSMSTYFTPNEKGQVTLTYLYKVDNDSETTTIPSEEYDTKATQAGIHIFRYELSAYNFENETIEIKSEIYKAEFSFDSTLWDVNTYEFKVFDFTKQPLDVVEGEQDKVTYVAKQISGPTGEEELISAGIYEYEIEFVSSDTNYTLINTQTYSTIIEIAAINIDWGIVPYSMTNTLTDAVITPSTLSTINSLDYTLKVSENEEFNMASYENVGITNVIKVISYAAQYSLLYFTMSIDSNSIASFINTHWNGDTVSASYLASAFTDIINNSIVTVFYKSANVGGKVYNKVDKELSQAIRSAGEYIIAIDTQQQNIEINGSSNLIIKFNISPIELMNVKQYPDNSLINIYRYVGPHYVQGYEELPDVDTGDKFIFTTSMLSSMEEFASYDGAPLYSFDLTDVDVYAYGYQLYLFNETYIDEYVDIVANAKLDVSCRLATIKYKTSTQLQLINEISDYLYGDILQLLGGENAPGTITSAGIYYLFVTTPSYATFNSSTKFVICLTVKPDEMDIENSLEFLSIKETYNNYNFSSTSSFDSADTEKQDEYSNYNGIPQFNVAIDFSWSSSINDYGNLLYPYFNNSGTKDYLYVLSYNLYFDKITLIAKSDLGTTSVRSLTNINAYDMKSHATSKYYTEYAFFYGDTLEEKYGSEVGDYYMIFDMGSSRFSINGSKAFVIHLRINPKDKDDISSSLFSTQRIPWKATKEYRYQLQFLFEKLGYQTITYYGRTYNTEDVRYIPIYTTRDYIGTISTPVEFKLDKRIYGTDPNNNVKNFSATIEIYKVDLLHMETSINEAIKYNGGVIIDNRLAVDGGNNFKNFKYYANTWYYQIFRYAEEDSTGEVNGYFYHMLFGENMCFCYYYNDAKQLVRCESLADYDKEIVVIHMDYYYQSQENTRFATRDATKDTSKPESWVDVIKNKGQYSIRLQLAPNTSYFDNYNSWNVYELNLTISALTIEFTDYTRSDNSVYQPIINKYSTNCDGNDHYNTVLEEMYFSTSSDNKYKPFSDLVDKFYGDTIEEKIKSMRDCTIFDIVYVNLNGTVNNVTTIENAGYYIISLYFISSNLSCLFYGSTTYINYAGTTLINAFCLANLIYELKTSIIDISSLQEEMRYTFGHVDVDCMNSAFEHSDGYTTMLEGFGWNESVLTKYNVLDISYFGLYNGNDYAIDMPIDQIGTYKMYVTIHANNLPSYFYLVYNGNQVRSSLFIVFTIEVVPLVVDVSAIPEEVTITYDGYDYSLASNLPRLEALQFNFFNILPMDYIEKLEGYKEGMPICDVTVRDLSIHTMVASQSYVPAITKAGDFEIAFIIKMDDFINNLGGALALTLNGKEQNHDFTYTFTLHINKLRVNRADLFDYSPHISIHYDYEGDDTILSEFKMAQTVNAGKYYNNPLNYYSYLEYFITRIQGDSGVSTSVSKFEKYNHSADVRASISEDASYKNDVYNHLAYYTGTDEYVNGLTRPAYISMTLTTDREPTTIEYQNIIFNYADANKNLGTAFCFEALINGKYERKGMDDFYTVSNDYNDIITIYNDNRLNGMYRQNTVYKTAEQCGLMGYNGTNARVDSNMALNTYYKRMFSLSDAGYRQRKYSDSSSKYYIVSFYINPYCIELIGNETNNRTNNVDPYRVFAIIELTAN